MWRVEKIALANGEPAELLTPEYCAGTVARFVAYAVAHGDDAACDAFDELLAGRYPNDSAEYEETLYRCFAAAGIDTQQ